MSAIVFAGRRKEPMRGGTPADDAVRGITARDVAIWMLYRSLARGDFHHDFGERTESRDLIVEGDRERFLEFAKNLTTKGMVWLEAQFTNKLKGKTLYELLGGSFDILVPRGFSSTDVSFPNEDSLIERITQTPYSTIKQEAVKAQYPEDPYTLDFTAGGVKRSYTVRSSSYREGERPKSLPKSGPAWEKYKRNRNISTMFKEVTGDKTKFALIVDATGGLALTDILNASLEPQPGVACQFYIIQNIENSSDSADKVQNMTVKPGPVGSPTASIFYLRDIGDTVVYPLWTTTETDQKSNIFASMQISLTRMKDGTVEADLLVNGGQSFHIGDVANASNVKNASLAAAAIMVEKGIVPEVFVYTLIKRMGDWCQALSMLDLDRVYNVTNAKGVPVQPQTTLRSMLIDTEIGVVTNDRILFAFCLFHGLNVFLTSAMDIARLIYFKNNNDLPDGPALLERATAILGNAVSEAASLRGSFDEVAGRLYSLVRERAQQITTTPSLPEYLALVKEFTVIVSRLDSKNFSTFDEQPEKAEFEQLMQQYEAARIANQGIPMFSLASQMIALNAKIRTRLTLGQQAIQRFMDRQYPGKSVIDVRVAALASKLAQGGRAPNSVPIVEARDTLVRVREDVEMIVKNVPALVQILRGIFGRGFAPTLREETNYGEVLKGLNPTRLILPPPSGGARSGGGQRGGATVGKVFNALRTRMIRLLPSDTTEVTSTTNTYKRGNDYIGEDMRAYTVVDEYIITKEDIPTFQEFDGGDPADSRTKYIDDRLNLLQFDMLRQRYANFLDSFAESVVLYSDPDGKVDPERTNETDIMEPGSQLYETMVSIWNEFRGIFEELIVSLRRPGFPDPAMPPELCPAQADVEIQFSRCRELFISIFSTQGAISQDAIKAQRIANGINRYDDYYKQLAFNAVLPSLPGRLVTVNPDRTQTPTPLGQNLLDVIQNAFLDQNDSDTVTEVRSKVDAQILRVATAVGNFVAVHRPTQDGGPAREAATRVGSLLTGGYKMQLIAQTAAEAAAEAAEAAAIEAEAARIDAARAAAAAAAEAAAAEERRIHEASMNGGRRKTHRRRGLPKLI